MDGVDWITALKSGAIANLADAGHLQFDLFDERNFISPTHDDYPASGWSRAAILLPRSSEPRNAMT